MDVRNWIVAKLVTHNQAIVVHILVRTLTQPEVRVETLLITLMNKILLALIAINKQVVPLLIMLALLK